MISNFCVQYALTLLSSVSGILALTLPHGWAFAPMSLAFLLADIVHAQSRNDAFIRSLIFGIATGGAGIWWAWGALPFLWLGYTSPFDGAYVMLIIWGLVSFALGVPIAIYGTTLWIARRSWLWPILATALWPIAEWGRMWAFALLAVGQNSLVGPHFSIAALGYSLAENPTLLQVANPGGIYALSFLTALMGALLFFIFVHRQQPSIGNATTILILLLASALPLSHTRGTIEQRAPLTIAVVHTTQHSAPDLPPSFDSIIESSASEYPNIIVFPEDHQIFTGQTHDDVVNKIRSRTGNNTLFALPERESGINGFYRSLVTLVSSKDGVISRYQKQFLMPEGEYSPFLSQWIFRLIGDERVESYFGSVRRLARGDTLAPVAFGNIRIGALMCSDGLSPYFYKELGDAGAHVLINMGDQTWFNGSKLLYDRLKLIAQVHAVESRAYAVVANRGSPSFVIDPYGKLVAESVRDTEGVLYATIH